jgi:hypothetical protein
MRPTNMAKGSDRVSEDLAKLGTLHELLAYVDASEGREGLLNTLENLQFTRDQLENYSHEYKKRGMSELASFVAGYGSTLSYTWDDPSDCPDYYHGDHAGWRWDQLRRHMMGQYAGDIDGYQAWLRGLISPGLAEQVATQGAPFTGRTWAFCCRSIKAPCAML